MKESVYIVWFRQDLRISDNPALAEAAKAGKILPIYIMETQRRQCSIGSASKIWLHHSLSSLSHSLEGKLNIYAGDSAWVIESILSKYNVLGVFFNELLEPSNIELDDAVKSMLDKNNVKYQVFNGSYLWHPKDILKDDGTYYKVFSAYKRRAYLTRPRKTINTPKDLLIIQDKDNKISLEDLSLIPQYQYYKKIKRSWEIGEKAAQKKLYDFIENGLSGYKDGRNYPARNNVSKLSPHLHFGEISPVQIWDAVSGQSLIGIEERDLEHFLSELIWREFSCYIIYYFKQLESDNFNNKFDNFPWQDNKVLLDAWKKGKTGYPLVDAGMRQLWQTGYIHNRVRMVVASFLVKNLNIHWHSGRDWFWDCLVDADLANNSASWQWVAGCGTDAAPYFRIFNPITQGEKFDQDGSYTKQFVPELAQLPNQYLFKPWQAPEEILHKAGVILGKTYNFPIVDLKQTRDRALKQYKNL